MGIKNGFTDAVNAAFKVNVDKFMAEQDAENLANLRAEMAQEGVETPASDIGIPKL